MQHHKKKRTLGRKRNQHTALLRSLALSLIKHEKITTTEAKAKELRPFVERLVTKGKSGTVAARRLLAERLGPTQNTAVKKLVDTIGKKYQDRAGGYTRIVKLAPRKSDSAKMAIIEFV